MCSDVQLTVWDLKAFTHCMKRNQVSHDHRSFERNLSNCEQKPEKVRTSTGFEPVHLLYCNVASLFFGLDQSVNTGLKIITKTYFYHRSQKEF